MKPVQFFNYIVSITMVLNKPVYRDNLKFDLVNFFEKSEHLHIK